MRTDQIRAFIRAAEHGSFAAAARASASRRSTLSAAVQALEDDLQITLFHRSGNRLQLSAAGEAILPDCQRLLHSAERIARRCEQMNQGVERTLRIARDDAIAEAIWRQALHALQQQFSETAIEVYLVPAQEHNALLKQHVVDIGFGLRQPQLHHDGEYATIASTDNLLVCHPTHPLAELPEARMSDLMQHRQICLAYMNHGKLLHSGLQLGNEQSERNQTTYTALTSYELIRDAIMAKHGWGVLPAFLLAEGIANGQLHTLKHDIELPPAVFQVRYEHPPGRASVWLQQYLRQRL